MASPDNSQDNSQDSSQESDHDSQEDKSDHDTQENISDHEYIDYDRDRIYNGSESGTVFTDHHAIPKRNEKSIRSDLEKLNSIPANIINVADSIYQKMDIGTKRGKRRKMLLFFCVFNAYNEEGTSVDAIWLAKVCGLERSSISKSLSLCSPVYTDAPMVKHTPRGAIPEQFERLSQLLKFHDGALEEIYQMTDEIMTADPSLGDEKPHTVSAAILVHYMKLHGYVLDKDNYEPAFKRSDMTINKVKKKVVAAYNQ